MGTRIAILPILFLLLLICFASADTAWSPPDETALKPKDVFKDCAQCPEMIVAPAGGYYMGPQPDAQSDLSTYQHVTFDRPFAAGRFAVTFEEWDACVADGGCNGYRPDDRGWGRGRMPVIQVSYDDAKAYTAWLSRKTGKPYRLLTAAEREYVTRAGTATPYWWGMKISPDLANYNDNYPFFDPHAPTHGYRRRTVPVDSFAPNPWGFYQVHGNVWEWVDDCSTDDIRHFTYCEMRGGSWASKPYELTSDSYLWKDPPDFRGIVGFRVARGL
jgi:formylglycine-generating enzyme required for sulfatase activity